MSKRKFRVGFYVEADIELDDRIFENVDNEFRNTLYNLSTEEEIIEHVARNVLINNFRLSSLDGWANLPDSCFKVLNKNIDLEICEECINE